MSIYTVDRCSSAAHLQSELLLRAVFSCCFLSTF